VRSERFTLAAPDGRILDVAVAGSPDGRAVVFHTGTPMAGLPFGPHVEAAQTRGLRLVHYSRPGYARSTRHPGRSVADCVADVTSVCDHLGVERFLTVGWSGGGPHALACAALLPDRVEAAATIASVTPYRAEGLDWMAGMAPENVEEFGLALNDHDGLVRFMRSWVKETRDATVEGLIDALGELASEIDRQELTAALGEYLLDSNREAFLDDVWGWFDDDLACTRAWGFDVSMIDVPVTIWQGPLDRFVPFAHGEWLASHIPGARAELRPEHGHLSLAVGAFPEILDGMLGGA
jgi:pimeloyl-ACP methyl ester carboxylesterase